MTVVRSPPPLIAPAALCQHTHHRRGGPGRHSLQQRVAGLRDFGAIQNRRGQVFEINLKTAKEMADGVSLADRMFSLRAAYSLSVHARCLSVFLPVSSPVLLTPRRRMLASVRSLQTEFKLEKLSFT